MKTVCAVFGCSNTRKNTAGIAPTVRFYAFPGRHYELNRKKIWIQFCKRKNGADGKDWIPSKRALICSRHFIGNKRSEHPLNPSYNPSIYPKQRDNERTEPSPRLARHDRYNARRKQQEQRLLLAQEQLEIPFVDTKEFGATVTTQTDGHEAAGQLKSFSCQSYGTGELATQVEHWTEEIIQAKETTEPSSAIKAQQPAKVSVSCGPNTKTMAFYGFSSVEDNEIRLKQLTSVSMNTFALLLSLLPPNSSRWDEIRRENRLLITLMKLKMGVPYSTIAGIVGCHHSTIGKVFAETLTILYDATSEWIIWPTREEIKATMPRCFRKNYPNCRVIIDCSEVMTEKPPMVSNQVQMYSAYKHGYTVKFLIGMTPGGAVSYSSANYGGRSSDAFITNDSGFLDKLEAGDEVMADKGFPSIKTYMESHNLNFVMPPFAQSNIPQFTVDEMEETYKVAAVRIHVERIIQRIKIYDVLTNKIPIELLRHVDKILHLCCILANFQPSIIRE